MATSNQVSNYHDQTVRPAAEMIWEVMTYAAHGVQCTMVDKSALNGVFYRVPYERMRPAFAEVRKREYFKHRPLPEVGLYLLESQPGLVRAGNPAQIPRLDLGRAPRLVQSHIPMGVIVGEDDNVSLERLCEYPLVYLAGTAIVSEKEVNLFGQYVSNGGNLLVTGVAGFYDHFGRLQEKSVLQDLLGVQAVKCRFDESGHWIRLPASLAGGNGSFLVQGIPMDWPLYIQAPTAVCKSVGAEAFGEILRPELDVIGPAVFVRPHGKGTVIYVPSAIDAAFVAQRRMPEHRNLIANLVRRLNPKPPVVVETLRNVETVVTRDDDRKRLLIHFISFTAPPRFRRTTTFPGKANACSRP